MTSVIVKFFWLSFYSRVLVKMCRCKFQCQVIKSSLWKLSSLCSNRKWYHDWTRWWGWYFDWCPWWFWGYRWLRTSISRIMRQRFRVDFQKFEKILRHRSPRKVSIWKNFENSIWIWKVNVVGTRFSFGFAFCVVTWDWFEFC